MNTHRAGFLKKNLGGLKFDFLCQNWPFLEVFRHFLEIYAHDFVHTATKCGGKWCGTNAEDRTSGKNPVLEIWPLLGEFWNFSEIKNDPKMVFSSNFTKYSHVIYRWSTNSILITVFSKKNPIFSFLAEKWLKRTPKISKILNFT